MATINTFRDLQVWQEGHGLVLDIYAVTRQFPLDEKFGITSQLRRAASSITANIAEGWARYHFKDRTRFYFQARGSWAETINFLVLAKDLGYLKQNDLNGFLVKTDLIGQLLNGLIRSAERQAQSAGVKSRITNH